MSFEVDVERRFGERRIAIRFAARAGVTALFGPSGAGKTTVLNMIAGLLRPDRGSIAVDGRSLFDSDQAIDIAPQRRRAGYVFQDGRLFPHMSVRRNLRYGERIASPGDRWIGFDETISFLGIDSLLERWPSTLSGGEARRVAIGRALLAGSRFLLLDEPFASLDDTNREAVLATIERIRDELNVPILFVSHDRRDVDRLMATIVEMPIGDSNPSPRAALVAEMGR